MEYTELQTALFEIYQTLLKTDNEMKIRNTPQHRISTKYVNAIWISQFVDLNKESFLLRQYG